MARRMPLGFVAALSALLLWFGVATAAFACPTTTAAMIERPAPDSLGRNEAAKHCALPSCVPICSVVTPAQVDASPVQARLASLYSPLVEAVEGDAQGPEPPPPRTV